MDSKVSTIIIASKGEQRNEKWKQVTADLFIVWWSEQTREIGGMCHLSWAHKGGKDATLQEPGASLQNELPVFEKSASALMNMTKVVKNIGFDAGMTTLLCHLGQVE